MGNAIDPRKNTIRVLQQGIFEHTNSEAKHVDRQIDFTHRHVFSVKNDDYYCAVDLTYRLFFVEVLTCFFLEKNSMWELGI